MADIISIEQVQSYLEKYKNKKLVVTGGCFDLLHIGHITLLENAKKQGDSLIVFVESDEDIKKKKGINRPIHSQKERAHMLSMIKPVDIVVPLKARMTNIDYDNLIQTIKPSVIATTENDSAIT